MASSVESVQAGVQVSTTIDESVTVAVVDPIATAKDTDPLTLDPPVADAVDFDALEALYDHSTEPWIVEFTVDDLTVTVESTGQVTVA